MNFRLTAALFAAIFVLGAVLLTLSLLDDKAVPDTLVEELSAAAVKPEEVERVEIERPPHGKLVMERKGPEKWEIVEPVKATAERFAVDALVSALFRAKPTHSPELTTNLQLHGLEPPSLRVTLRSKGGASSVVNVGEVTLGGNKAIAFLTTSARKRPIAVPRSALDSLLRDPSASGPAGNNAKWTSDFRAKAVFSIDSRKIPDVTAIKLTNKDKTLELTHAGDGWTFASPANWGAADSTGDTNPAATGFTGVSPMLTALTSLQAQSSDDFIETPGDLKQYGLEPGNPDMVRVELKSKDGPAEVVFIGKQVPAAAAQGVPPTPSTKWFVKIEGETSVIRANAVKLDGLVGIVADPNPIRDRTLLTFDKIRVDAIDLAFGGQTVKLRKTGGVPQWKLYGAPNDPTLVDAKLIDAMLNVLAERRTIRDFPPANDANFAGPESKLEIKLWADGIEADPKADAKAEPKLKGNPFTLQFGRQEGDKFFVRRTLASGAKADFTLPALVPTSGAVPVSIELLPTLRKDRLALLDTTLPTFSPFGVSKLTITNGPAVTELDKADDPASPLAGKWTFAKPDAQKGRVADGDAIQIDMLGTLARQSATRFIAETPTEKQLADWGLDPKGPRMKVVVGMKTGEAEKERVYYIGNDAGDGFVYARIEGRPAVFTVPKLVVEKLTTTDLRDKTVAKFDRSKVKGLRIRGWKEVAPEKVMLVREFEKKGTEWVAKGPGYTADGAKINTLLAILDGLKAKAFVPGLPVPEHRFPPETESGFEITIELDGAPPLSVNIAGETPDKTAYFGFSSMLPAGEQLFTVPVDALRSFKATPASLAK